MYLWGLFLSISIAMMAQNPIEIPFRLAAPDLPLVLIEVQINNVKGLTAVLDTGQGLAPVLVNEGMAKELGVAFRDGEDLPAAFAVGSGALPKVHRSRLQGFYVGGVGLGAVEAGVTSALDGISARIDQRIAANLGYPLLKDYTLTIDYRRLVLTLSRQALASRFAFVLGAKRPLAIVEVKVNGLGPYRFALDTGATSSVISRMLADRLTMPRGTAVPVMGAAGATSTYMTRAQSIEVAGRRLPEFEFATGDFFDRLSDSVGTTIDGILGANAFQNRVLRIDYPNLKFSLDNP